MTISDLLAHGELVFLVTEDDIYLGTAEVLDSVLVVRSGCVGRPTLVPLADVVSVALASAHSLVEE